MNTKLIFTVMIILCALLSRPAFAQSTSQVVEAVPENQISESTASQQTNPSQQLLNLSNPTLYGPQKTQTSNAVCVKVGNADESAKAQACVQQPQSDAGFTGPIIPQYCGQDLAGQPIMCIKPQSVFYCQGDSRWGSICNLSQAGCGPTTMAMVFSSYGDTIIPPDMDKIFQSRGWRSCADIGSSMQTAVQTLLPENGYEYHALGAPLNLERAQEYLNAGYLIIGSTSDHIFVIDGVDPANQTVRLRDPGRCENAPGVIRPANTPWAGQSFTYSYAVKKNL